MSREALIKKMKAVLEMARRGGTEAEQAMAAQRIAEMLTKYNIDLSEIDGDASTSYDAENILGKYNETWRHACYQAAARMYMCRYMWKVQRGAQFAVTRILVGEPHNLAVATEMAAYFEDSINRLANDAAKNNKSVTGASHTSRHRFIRTFRLEAAERLKARVEVYVRDAMAGRIVDQETGTTLPATLSLYERQEELYQEWIKANGLRISEAAPNRDMKLSDLGRELGRQAGDNISLSAQISSSNNFALPSS